jgi:hypothetical protein
MRTLAGIAVGALSVAALAAPAGSEWTLVSRGPSGSPANGGSYECAVTPNGRFVAYHSQATDLVNPAAGTASQDVFVTDRKTGVTELISANADGGEANGSSSNASISNNGRWVLFKSSASDLVAGDTEGTDVFVADRTAGTITRVSEKYNGEQTSGSSDIYGGCLSGNGRYAVFVSNGQDIVNGVDTHDYYQVYMRDLRTGETFLVSRDREDPLSGATGTCSLPTISSNGRFVGFTCNSANLVPGSSNGQMHAYVRDMKKGTMARVSQTAEGTLADNNNYDPVVSNNGRWVAFYSYATNLAPGDAFGSYDTFLWDRTTGAVVRMSDPSDGESSYSASISASGKVIVFYSEQGGIVEGDNNDTGDVFRYDPKTGAVTRLSVDAAGVEGNGYSYVFAGSLSSNGKWLAMSTDASNLPAPSSEDGHYDVYVRPVK